ncbi:MAG: hypothetical protein J2P48_14690 [Alphaproteobacteria bacterium]|nr:hypothetical protein [Alphaproteobacteria bacterium]
MIAPPQHDIPLAGLAQAKPGGVQLLPGSASARLPITESRFAFFDKGRQSGIRVPKCDGIEIGEGTGSASSFACLKAAAHSRRSLSELPSTP